MTSKTQWTTGEATPQQHVDAHHQLYPAIFSANGDTVAYVNEEADANLIVKAVNAHEALVKELKRLTPEDPFQGDELSGGPACIDCHTDRYNAEHRPGSTTCGWMRRRALLATLK